MAHDMHDLPHSSHVEAVGHDGTALVIRYRGRRGEPGRTYRYASAGPEHLDALKATDSPGRYVLDRIKHVHEGKPVE